MGSFSVTHWVIVLIIVVLVFGTKKLRNVGKDLGGAVHDFKKRAERRHRRSECKKKTKSSNIKKTKKTKPDLCLISV